MRILINEFACYSQVQFYAHHTWFHEHMKECVDNSIYHLISYIAHVHGRFLFMGWCNATLLSSVLKNNCKNAANWSGVNKWLPRFLCMLIHVPDVLPLRWQTGHNFELAINTPETTAPGFSCFFFFFFFKKKKRFLCILYLFSPICLPLSICTHINKHTQARTSC